MVHHGVDALDAELDRLVHGLPGDDAGSDFFHRGELAEALMRPLAVDGVAERVDHPAEELRTRRHFQDALGAARRHALGEAS